ncbi:MAG TPA: hypothetical protein VFV08_01455 [Puia sp.]|nr:hypothetical protein [Puia sp.]
MKTLKKLINWTIVFSLTGILTQCNKSTAKKTSCQIITVTPAPNGTPFHLTYNSDGKPIRVESQDFLMIYEYNTSSTTISSFSGGNFQAKTVATLNSDGLATNVRTDLDSLGTNWSNIIYEYNGQELSRSTQTSSTNGRPVVSTYTWSNQNLVLIVTDTTSETLGYYLDKPVQAGDYFLLVQQLQGYDLYRNKNLLKSLDATSLNYQFGSDGKINSLSATTGANENFLN